MANIKQIAAIAEVSTATVSHVLNQSAKVSPKLRDRVLKAVKDLNYIPSSLPGALKTRVSRSVGIVITDITNPFYGAIVRGAEDVFAREGYTLLVGNSDGDEHKEEKYYRTFVSKRVDGLVLITCPTAYPPSYLSRHNMEEIPVVLINRDYPSVRADEVLADGQEGAFDAVNHLIKAGHRRIGIITGPAAHVSSHQRLLGYKRALLEHGVRVDDELIRDGQFEIKSGYEQAKLLLSLPQRPTALFVCNVAMTMATLRAIIDCGLRCPEEVGLVCFDDSEWFNLIRPKISAVAQPSYELGATAARTLLKRISRQLVTPPQMMVLKTELIIRESSNRELSSDLIDHDTEQNSSFARKA
jgi:LacI family transcriptional regulator